MKIYSNSVDAISDLHEKGFTHDFQLFGNDLLLVQEGIFVRAGEFAILEYHKIKSGTNDGEEEIVFGVAAPYHHIKGILLNHYKGHTDGTPPVLVRKLKEMNQEDQEKQSGSLMNSSDLTQKHQEDIFNNND